MTEQRSIAPNEDPVCAMRVDPAEARRQDLRFRHLDTEYAFCSTECLTDFCADPAWFLDPAYAPKPR